MSLCLHSFVVMPDSVGVDAEQPWRPDVCLWVSRVHQTLMLIRPGSFLIRSQSQGAGSLLFLTKHFSSSWLCVRKMSVLSLHIVCTVVFSRRTVSSVWIERWCLSVFEQTGAALIVQQTYTEFIIIVIMGWKGGTGYY